MTEKRLAPVILFVFNRPDHTRRCLDALSRNVDVDKSVIHVFADGPKLNDLDENITKIKEVRDIVCQYKSIMKIETYFSDENKGLAKSVLEGVTVIVDKFDEVIVLEDDLICSKYFIRFMNNCLSYYRNERKVFHIGGYSPPLKMRKETYFLSFASSWGWATWKDRWNEFISDPKEIIKEIDKKDLKNAFDFGDCYPYYNILERQVKGEIDSWAIRWNGTVFLKEGLGVYPVKSLIRNVGFDGSGVHSGNGEWYKVKINNQYCPKLKEEEVLENQEARAKTGEFYLQLNKVSLWQKIKQKVKHEINNAKGTAH